MILAGERGSAPSVSGAGPNGRAEIVRRGPNAVTIRAQLDRPGYVVLLDRYDPNWQAAVDGRAVHVLRANQLFRAVYAGAGKHDIEFYYRQGGLKMGLTLSLVGLAGLVILYLADPKVGVLN